MTGETIEVHLHGLTCPRCGRTLAVPDAQIVEALEGKPVRLTCECGLGCTLNPAVEPNA